MRKIGLLPYEFNVGRLLGRRPSTHFEAAATPSCRRASRVESSIRRVRTSSRIGGGPRRPSTAARVRFTSRRPALCGWAGAVRAAVSFVARSSLRRPLPDRLADTPLASTVTFGDPVQSPSTPRLSQTARVNALDIVVCVGTESAFMQLVMCGAPALRHFRTYALGVRSVVVAPAIRCHPRVRRPGTPRAELVDDGPQAVSGCEMEGEPFQGGLDHARRARRRLVHAALNHQSRQAQEIGRASCRERV